MSSDAAGMQVNKATAGLMSGKRGLIMGLANDKSIAWGIASAVAAHGAELAFTYQNDKLKGRVELVPPGALPRDGLVIEDARSYD